MGGETSLTSLADVVDILSGGTPSKGQGSYWNGTIPWVSAKDMSELRLRNSEDHITPAGLKNGSRLAPAGSTLVLVRGMTLLSDVPICTADRDVAFNQDIKALVPRHGVDAAYLTYALLAAKPALQSMVELAGHGTGRLPTDRLKAMEIRLPPLADQQAIAHILGTLDDKIDLNRRMNETLEGIARALFKSWFVDFDPVDGMVDRRSVRAEVEAELLPAKPATSEEPGMPDGWSLRPLDSVAHFLNGLALQEYPADGNGHLPVIKISELRSGITPNSGKASVRIPREYVVQQGDVLFSWSGSLELTVWYGAPGALNQHLFKVTSADYPKWFYYRWLDYYLPHFRSVAAAKATTMGHIQRHHLTEAVVTVPPPSVIAHMNAIMGPLLERIVWNNVESHTLAAHRDALLPKLLSGEIRAKNADRLASDAV